MLNTQQMTQAQKNARNKKNKKAEKQAGFSLQGMLIASLIGSLLAGATIISMWGSVDKATITAEMASINAFKNATSGLLETNGSYPTKLSISTVPVPTDPDVIARSKVSQMPKELKYQLILMQGATTSTSDDWIGLKAYAADQGGADRLNAVVEELDLKIDGVVDPAAGRFVYKSACSAPATVATSATDCFYITPLLAKGGMPTNATGNDTSTAGVAHDADTSAENDQRTNMN